MKKDLSSYVMNTEELIRKLQGSNLFAECPSCGGEFKLSQSLLPARVGPRQEYEITVEVRKKGSKRGLSTTFLASKMAF